MSLRLPLTGTKTREMLDMELLASLASAENRMKLPTFREALTSARKFLKAEKAARSIFSYTLRADGELWLLKVNRNGSWKMAWNFGKLV